MMVEYEVQRSTRHCAATGRDLAPGEEFFSAVIAEGAELKRYDYAVEAWKGPPEQAIGWWKSRVPTADARRMRWAPNEVMLQFFEEIQQQTQRQDMLYVLALLLVRRRVMRLEEEEHDADGREVLVLYCPRRETTYRVPVAAPDETRIVAIQDELAKLLFSHAK